MTLLDGLFLSTSLFCTGYAIYLHRFIKRHREDTDPRRREQASAYAKHHLVKKFAIGAVLSAAIVVTDLLSPHL